MKAHDLARELLKLPNDDVFADGHCCGQTTGRVASLYVDWDGSIVITEGEPPTPEEIQEEKVSAEERQRREEEAKQREEERMRKFKEEWKPLLP